MNPIPDDPRAPAFMLSLHDVAPHSWPLYRAFLAELEQEEEGGELRCTLLTVPDFHHYDVADRHPAFCRALRARQDAGDELVLHGYYHEDDGPAPQTPRGLLRRRVLTHEGEFSALNRGEAARRIRDGLAMFYGQGWRADGFVPPGWVTNSDGRNAIREAGFAYRTDSGAIYRLPDERRWPLPTLVMSSRSAWRRRLFILLNRWRMLYYRNAPILRLALHPVDLRHEESRQFWLDTVRTLRQERRSVTKRRWLLEQSRLEQPRAVR